MPADLQQAAIVEGSVDREGAVGAAGKDWQGVGDRDRALVGDHAGNAAVAAERRAGDDINGTAAGQRRTGMGRIADRERSGQHGGAAGIGIVGGEDCGAGSDLCHGAGTGDDTAEGHGVGAVESEHTIVEHVAHNAAAGAAVAEMQGAGRDRRAAAVGVVGGEHRGAGADVGQGAGPRDDAGEGHGVGAVEGEHTVVEHVADDAA